MHRVRHRGFDPNQLFIDVLEVDLQLLLVLGPQRRPGVDVDLGNLDGGGDPCEGSLEPYIDSKHAVCNSGVERGDAVGLRLAERCRGIGLKGVPLNHDF